jgi:uncharacterized protein
MSDGWSDLMRAAGRGDTAEVRALLGAGADPAETAPDGRTAHDVAVAAGHREAALLLRSAAGSDGAPWRPYSRAYRLGDLRAFPEWRADGADAGLGDDEIVFLHDDLTVSRSPLRRQEDVLREGESPAWGAFCRDTLGFAVPDELDLVPTA